MAEFAHFTNDKLRKLIKTYVEDECSRNFSLQVGISEGGDYKGGDLPQYEEFITPEDKQEAMCLALEYLIECKRRNKNCTEYKESLEEKEACLRLASLILGEPITYWYLSQSMFGGVKRLNFHTLNKVLFVDANMDDFFLDNQHSPKLWKEFFRQLARIYGKNKEVK